MKKRNRIFAAVQNDRTLELMIYSDIGENWYGTGVTAADVAAKLRDAGQIDKIVLRLNSPGGSVFEGSAIYSLLSQHPAQVECYVDGLAASAAFTIAMAADTVHCSESALMMCHNAWGMASGDANDMRKMADTLDKVSSTMRDIYAKASGQDADAVQALMDNETWMTAAEAVEAGFADDVITRNDTEEQEAQALAASFKLLSKFTKVPERLKSKVQPTTAICAADGCQCSCQECLDGDCEKCSHVECDCVGCECDQNLGASANLSIYERRIHLVELAGR